MVERAPTEAKRMLVRYKFENKDLTLLYQFLLILCAAVSSGPLINLVNTPSVGEDQKLLSVTFLQVCLLWRHMFVSATALP